MSNEVKELLTIIGERSIRGLFPPYTRKFDNETKQQVITIPGQDRKLVIDPDGEINWFDAVNGPAE